jgi:hypothetical protein
MSPMLLAEQPHCFVIFGVLADFVGQSKRASCFLAEDLLLESNWQDFAVAAYHVRMKRLIYGTWVFSLDRRAACRLHGGAF